MAGDEDLSDVRGKTPEEVLESFDVFMSALRAHGVEAPVVFVSIRPSPMRASRWLGAKRANGLIEEFAKPRDDIIYLDVASLMFTAEDEMRDELFRWDGLSLSTEGYALLTSRLRPLLDRRFNSEKEIP
jgi:lysophospholipase L1-like esterase